MKTLLKTGKSVSGYTVSLYRVDFDRFGHYFVVESDAPGALAEMAWEIGEIWTWTFKAYMQD